MSIRSLSKDRTRHGWLRPTLVGLEAFVGVGAVYGAVMLIGHAWHLPVTDLAPLALRSWVLPGIALLLLVALPMGGAAAAMWRRLPRAAEMSVAAGLVLAGWVLMQVAIIGPQMFLQGVMLLVGLAVAGLGWLRHTPTG
jgi:hypothetical protein